MALTYTWCSRMARLYIGKVYPIAMLPRSLSRVASLHPVERLRSLQVTSQVTCAAKRSRASLTSMAEFAAWTSRVGVSPARQPSAFWVSPE